jgi:hypothetical protein
MKVTPITEYVDKYRQNWGIRTHDLSVQAIKAYASDRVATGTAKLKIYFT